MSVVLKLLKVQSQLLAFVGLMVVGLVAMQLVKGEITVGTAATRVLVVTVALSMADRYLLPLARTLVTSGQRPRD